MAMITAASGGSTWASKILAAIHGVMQATSGLTMGNPIKMTTRAVPTHLPLVLLEATDGVLLGVFDGIPLYSLGSATQNKLACTYPDGTSTDVTCVQE